MTIVTRGYTRKGDSFLPNFLDELRRRVPAGGAR